MPDEAAVVGGDALRRILRFGQLGAGPKGTATLDKVMEVFLLDLRESGLPDEAINRIEQFGTGIFKKSSLPPSVAKLMGGKEGVAHAKDSLKLARGALKGVSGTELKGQFREFLRLLKESAGDDPDVDRIIGELRKVGPKKLASLGAATTLTAMERRGADPMVQRLYRAAAKKAPTPQVATNIAAAVTAAVGKMPKTTGATRAALTQAGVGGVSKAASVLRPIGRAVTGASPIGAAIGIGVTGAFLAPRIMDKLQAPSRARKAAMQGFGALGPASSMEFLKGVVEQQEAVSRRKMTLKALEPDMFNQILQLLSSPGEDPQGLTSSEARIGGPVGGGYQGRRSAKDVHFLLDELVGQMG